MLKIKLLFVYLLVAAGMLTLSSCEKEDEQGAVAPAKKEQVSVFTDQQVISKAPAVRSEGKPAAPAGRMENSNCKAIFYSTAPWQGKHAIFSTNGVVEAGQSQWFRVDNIESGSLYTAVIEEGRMEDDVDIYVYGVNYSALFNGGEFLTLIGASTLPAWQGCDMVSFTKANLPAGTDFIVVRVVGYSRAGFWLDVAKQKQPL